MKTDYAGRVRTFLLTAVALTLSACGGGGGGGGGGPSSPPPPAPKSISGIVMLGPVANADIEIVGTSGVLATGTTASDGTFGPISYSGSYSGPLRIRAVGGASSTWICDFRFGCAVGGGVVPWGSAVDFDGELEAVLPTAVNNQRVSVSFLSNLAAKRMDTLGSLTQANVDTANTFVAETLRGLFSDLLTNLVLTLPDNFNEIELFDLQNLPAPGTPDDSISMILSLMNSSLMGLGQPNLTTGQLLDQFSTGFAGLDQLPVSSMDPSQPSQESFIVVLTAQLFEILNTNEPSVSAIDALLAPFFLTDAVDATLNAFFAIPSLNPGSSVFQFIDDAALQGPIVSLVPIFTSTGAPLAVGDITARVALTPTQLTIPSWISVSQVDIGGQVNVRVEFDAAEVANLSNGNYQVGIEVISTTGEYRRGFIDVFMDLVLVGRQASAGNDIVADERSTVTLSGSTTSPGEVDSVAWTQLSGPTVTITGADTLQPSVELPGIDVDDVVTMQLDVSFTTGERRIDTMSIFIQAFPLIADVTLADAVLQQCVDAAASGGGLSEVGELTTLSCADVANAAGIEVFANLESLTLANNTLETLQPLLALDSLLFLDLRGNTTLPCNEVDQLAERLAEGTDLLVDDTCLGGFALDLNGIGFDAALDSVRDQIYISVPSRNEIVVLSTTELRIVDRLSVPGSPNGIDLSLDGTRLFAALNGSNAVAVIDIGLRSVTTIDLGDVTDHPTTYDVLEGAPDRLFVTAAPGSGGFAYVAQVRLDQGNIATRVANQRIIRARPTLARSPDQQFIYVGTGFSPNSLLKLSLLEDDAPIVLEDDHGSVSGTDNLVLNQSGTRIALGSGQVLRTGSFIEEGRVTPGRSVASAITDTFYVAGSGGLVEAFDFDTLALTGQVETRCDNGSTSRILAYNGDASFMLLQQDVACLFASVSRSTPPDPFSALRFTDLALEECVIDTAVAMGYTQPDEFTSLDCSGATRTILSLDGIDRLSNLATLDISNSGVIDLSPLAGLSSLQGLVARNTPISDVSPLLSVASLASVDLTGSDGVPCSDLDQVVLGGVSVSAANCVDTVRVELGGIGQDLVFDTAAGVAFVSIPSLNRVSEIDLGDGSIARSFTLAGQPYGIELSTDGGTIYAAMFGDGDLGVLDIASGDFEAIDISVELDDDRTWDVAEVSADRVLVSTNPGSNGFGYIVEVRRDLSNQATRVASQRIIRASPIFAVSPDQTAVYVGEGFSPNSLYKLDATQSDLPIVLEDDHGVVSGTSSLAISPDGSRIYLRSGQVVSTETLDPVGLFPGGRSTVSADGEALLVGDTGTDSARVYSTTTTGQIGNRSWGCNLQNLQVIEEFGDGVLVLGDDLVCYSQTVPYP